MSFDDFLKRYKDITLIGVIVLTTTILIIMFIVTPRFKKVQKLIKKEIDDELYRMYTLNSFYHTPGTVTVINASNINVVCVFDKNINTKNATSAIPVKTLFFIFFSVVIS